MSVDAPLTLSDGRTLTLVLDFNALVEAERAYGKPLPHLLADSVTGFAGANRALFWGSLQAKHSDITMADATAILGRDMALIVKAMERAEQAINKPAPKRRAPAKRKA